jgi:hypothetical protein
MSDTVSESALPAIDWSAVSTNIECPLCLYNLRGLIEPRCPECGYEFEWAELLDPQHQKHRYLFEHHPRRNLWSFWRTLIGGLRARRFWSELKPTHTVRPRRLLVYWILCSCFVLLTPVVEIGQIAMRSAIFNADARKTFPTGRRGQYTPQTRQRYLDRYYPMPPDPRFFQTVAMSIGGPLFIQIGLNVAMVLVWPWLTFAALMIFQISMQRRGVRPAHVLRCVIYSADANTWYFLLTLAATVVTTLYVTLRSGNTSFVFSQALSEGLLLLLWVVRLDRLSTAYKRYLHFDHPFWTTLASQVIVVLAGAGMLYWGSRVASWFSS